MAFASSMSVTEGKNGDKNLYIGEMGPPDVQIGVKGLGNRIVILSPEREKNRCVWSWATWPK